MRHQRLGLIAAIAALAGFVLPAVAFAQTVPDFTHLGFSTVVASTNLAAGAAGSVHYGSIAVQIPAGAFSDPVKFELLEGPVAKFQANVPAGQTVISDFALKVVDMATGQLVGTFQKPVTYSLTSSDVTASSVYDNVTLSGSIVQNPIPAMIAGNVLTHPIAAALVGWVVTSPSSAVTPIPDLRQYGFPTVVASQNLAAGAAGSLHYGGISVQIPAEAFPTAVDFELLEGPLANFQMKAPSGQTVISDFAFRVVDSATGQLVGNFQKQVLVSLTGSSVTSSSVYDNFATGMLMPNPVPATISGMTLTHPIAAALVGWVVTSPSSAVTMAPDMTRHGFVQVVASTRLAMGAAGSLQYGPIRVDIPAGTFDCAVDFELLKAPTSNLSAPAGQTVISDFAFKVVDTANDQLIGQFKKPVRISLTSSAVTAASIYYNVTPGGMLVANQVPAAISGHTLTHPITAALVGWAVTSPAKAVPAATSPTTGVPLLPVMLAGAALIATGVLLIRRARVA